MNGEQPISQPMPAPPMHTGGGDTAFKVVVGIVLGLSVLSNIFLWVRVNRVINAAPDLGKATTEVNNLLKTAEDRIDSKTAELKTKLDAIQATADDNQKRIDDVKAQADENKAAIDEVKAEVEALK